MAEEDEMIVAAPDCKRKFEDLHSNDGENKSPRLDDDNLNHLEENASSEEVQDVSKDNTEETTDPTDTKEIPVEDAKEIHVDSSSIDPTFQHYASSSRQNQPISGSDTTTTREIEVPSNKELNLKDLLGSIHEFENLMNAMFPEADAGGSLALLDRVLSPTQDIVESDQIQIQVPNEKEFNLNDFLESIDKAEKLLNAMIAEDDAGGSPAFVARGLSPADAIVGSDQIQIQVPNEKFSQMPRGKANCSLVAKKSEPEPEKTVESDEKIDLEEENDPEEEMEEIEYEEVEEEEEVEEIEEEVEEKEEDAEEEEEEEEKEEEEVEEDDTMQNLDDDDEKKKHAELLSLPHHKSEVYVGGIPLDAKTEDLKEFCECIGEVVQVRIFKGKDASENRGFAFVTYRSIELASKAIKELNNTEFKAGKIKCSKSQAKSRLFIGNIPRSWGEKDLKKVVSDIGPGVTAVELIKDMKNISNNRGYAFIDYHNNQCAEYSRQKMTSPSFKLGDNFPTVNWAEPKNADSSASSQVKEVYVKNLPKNVTKEQLKKLFEHHGKITKVVLPPPKPGQEKNRIGFVHFAERSNAMKALKNTEKYVLDGQILECSLAKQQADPKAVVSNIQTQGSLPRYPPHVGYGLDGNPYGVLGAGYGAPGLAQPFTYGLGQTPGGIAMMPKLLVDRRIRYVLQQPGLQPHPTHPAHPTFTSKRWHEWRRW
ncbi:heterogeneous nuclear ribonucleoprotein Q isoform X1 [Medicago truncatula]|uniref:heterogeneous nuclear ribonucleoprotein Q isoform X1 n=2 Tax=Medicago truncatula TaxID=3880 RepID=UPI000D2F438A|nr:heterogeneous nuclear ribonucleoprotein Q isoform X1 [Medicago truncatula]